MLSHHKSKYSIIICILLFSSFLFLATSAQDSDLILKSEQEWETYGIGTTCISGSQNLFVGDVDGDGLMEIITGGFMYTLIDGSRGPTQAPLMIWNWDGQEVTLELSHKWDGRIRAIYAADLNGDDMIELITAGSIRNETGTYSTIRVWHWNNQELSLRAHYEGVTVSSIYVCDLNNDGTLEILTVGRLTKDSTITAQLGIWHFENDNLTMIDKLELDVANVTNANSVYASDLDNNGETEIVIVGYSDYLNNSKGQISIWHWNEEFTLKANEKWHTVEGYGLTIAGGVQGNTIANNVKVADLNEDKTKEIITGGFEWDGERVNSQLKIWKWDGTLLTQMSSQEWANDYLNEVKCVSINDVDGDGKMDIITSGTVATYGSFANASTIPDRGQLRVWSWEEKVLSLKQSEEWSIGEGVCAWNVVADDLDGNGVNEIVTVGCAAEFGLCDPNMRIWTVPQVSVPSGNLNYVITGAIGGVLVFFVFLLFLRKKASK